MARHHLTLGAAACLLLAAMGASAQSVPPTDPPDESFYSKSLHFTNRGIEFVYSKEQGGLEQITGLSASEVGCVKAKCHATTCDMCHRKNIGGKATYSLDPAVAQAACEGCHGTPEKDDPDVHARKGMKCMSCHSTREVHGDGVAYDSYMQPGVLDTRCEKCHSEISNSASHTIHRTKLACGACHTAKVGTCINCHVARVQGTKGVKMPLEGMLFLVNHGGRVTTANLLTCIYRSKTMITFAPTFSHSIAKQGRACADCHDSAIVRGIAAGTFAPVTWADGKVTNVKGQLPFLTLTDGKWTPLADAAPPVLHFSGTCAPLTREQLAKLSKAEPEK
jgi:hypothetical protein